MTVMESIRDRKERLREEFRQARLSLDEEYYQEFSRAVCDRIYQMQAVQDARVIHLYWPIVERREIDTRPLVNKLYEDGHLVALPVVEMTNDEPPSLPAMRTVRYDGRASLQKNRWGVSEPVDTDPVPREAIDVVIVPAFGAGRNRHRIGHGYGYYDAFLDTLDAYTICPVFPACLVDDVPHEPHDVPLNCILTDEEIIRHEA